MCFYLVLSADSTNNAKVALSSIERTPSIKDSSVIVLTKGIHSTSDKTSQETTSPTTNISLIASESGNFCPSKHVDNSASGNEIPSQLTNPSLLSHKPLLLPRPQSSLTAMDQQVQQDAYKRRSSNNSNTSNEMPTLALIGPVGHPARLGGPSQGSFMRNPGPMHWHGLSGSRM